LKIYAWFVLVGWLIKDCAICAKLQKQSFGWVSQNAVMAYFCLMEFLPEQVQSYVEMHTDQESDLLKKIARETHMHVLHPRMLSGNFQGRILAMISHMLGPERIL
jgi:hypothetical protein